ncbi:MAG TPA: arylsulfatase [Planctomycetota bacterium]
MPRRPFSVAAVLLLAGCADSPPPPDVIVIMTDDQGIGDFGFLGSTQVETPHLDALAAGSARLAQFYVHPVCAPTRAALMTGRYPQRTRAFDTYVGRALLEPEETTIAELLKAAGYATGIFGKWHLGDCAPMRPQDQGFDFALVHRGGGIGQPSDPPGGEGRYTDPVLLKNGERVEWKGYCTDLYFEAALEWIAQQRAAGKPYFAYLPTNAPHGPFRDLPAAWLAHYLERFPADDRLARIFAMISNVDENVGRLVAALAQAGALDNTLVVFLVDNGPNTRRFVGELRGMKTEVHEGGVRSPLLAHWPARLQPRLVQAGYGANIDLLPTILEACGVEAPGDLDGRSLLPALEHGAALAERALVVQAHRGDRPVRHHHFLLRRGRFKLVNPSGFGKQLETAPLALELYDLLDDPGEAHDLAAARPELVAELLAEYDAWFDSTCAPEGEYLPPPIHFGDPAERVVAFTRQDWRRSRSEGDGNWGEQGVWRVRVLETGPWGFTLRWRGEPAPVRAVLHCGPFEFAAEVPPGVGTFELGPVELPLGAHELRVDLHRTTGAAIGPYQVLARPIGG